MLIVAFLTIRPAAMIGGREQNIAWVAALVIVITFVGGTLSFTPAGGWWSYLMAAGTTVGILLYGMLYVRTR